MTTLPTYEEATRLTWLQLVAPYIPAPRDLQALCLVNKAFCNICRPLLWTQPLQTARQAGFLDENGLTWWLHFAFRLPTISKEVRELTQVLDAGDFSWVINQYGLTERSEAIESSFKKALEALPNLACILLDGLRIVDVTNLCYEYIRRGVENPIRLLSLVNCRYEMRCILHTAFENLVYLDISGASRSTLQTFQPSKFPRLRVLKIGDRELNNAGLQMIMEGFSGQLWSLDVSDNRLSDEIVSRLIPWDFNPQELRDSQHLEELESASVVEPEGDLSTSQQWYLAGPPSYEAQHPPEGWANHLVWRRRPSRGTGVSPLRRDDPKTMIRKLSVENSHEWEDVVQAPIGLTHLHISGNKFTSFGIRDLLRNSRGHLETFACDSMSLVTLPEGYRKVWPRTTNLYGCVGMAYALQPAISVNLRELCIHHSLITQVLTFEAEGWSSMAKLYFAETSILPRSEQAFPEAFTPDTNPRLTSLTLKRIPRRSSGPLIQKLLNFLRALAIQERNILDMHGPPSRRQGPGITALMGLRHLTLEFEPPPMMEDGWSTGSFDAEELLQSGDKPFSFFDDENEVVAREDVASLDVPKSRSQQEAGASMGVGATSNMQGSNVSDTAPVDEWEQVSILATNQNTRQPRLTQVWVGYKEPSRNPIINQYRRLVLYNNLRHYPAPATPAQVLAGVPKGAFLWQTAWYAAVMPPEIKMPMGQHINSMMKDVMEPIKTYRLNGREEYRKKGYKIFKDDEHLYWTGMLQVVYQQRKSDMGL